LQATYLLTPEWQRAVPHALTVFGWDELRRYLASTHGLMDQWVRRFRLTRPYRAADELRLLLQARPTLAPSFPKDGDVVAIRAWIRSHRELVMPNAQWFAELSQYLPDRLSVNVLAHFRYPSGLQEAAVNVVRGLESVDVRTIRRDLPVHFPSDWSDQERYQGVELSDVTIFNGAINRFLDEYIPHAGLHLRGGVYRIAIWYWELEKLPAEWVERIEKHHLIDEVWAPTKFIADAIRSHLKLPVFPMLPGLELPPFTPQPRERFGLDASKFLFLFMFDMNSDMNRKNPLGLIEAFRKAFGSRTDVQLAIKVSRGDSHRRNQSLLIDACRNAGVVLMDEVLPRNDVLALLNTADCYVSLHRSEGFGLTMAESMLLGKPTIGTAYSGNLDFMTSETNYLVEYERVPIVDELSFYPQGCMWADPLIEHAAQLMRRVFENRDEARRIGEAGQKSLRELLSVRSAGERMLARLRELDQDS